MKSGVLRSEPQEIEAKFLIRSPSIHRRLAAIRTLGPFRLIRWGREVQDNRYWDSRGLCLRRCRAALKTRQVGGRAEITFKREIAYQRGISRRIELTVPARPDRIEALMRGIKYCVPVFRARRIVGSRALKQVLWLRTFRRKLLFGRGRQRVELDLDRVEIRKDGERIGTHLEVELENRGASEGSFQEALTALQRRFGKGLRLSRVPKYELGLRFLKKQEQNKGGNKIGPAGSDWVRKGGMTQ